MKLRVWVVNVNLDQIAERVVLVTRRQIERVAVCRVGTIDFDQAAQSVIPKPLLMRRSARE